MEMIKCTSTSASLKFYMFRAISVSCLRFIFLPFQCQMWTEYQMIHFLRSSLLVFARFQCLCGFCSSSISYYLSYKVCFYQGGSSEWRCWCIERSCLSLLKAFVSWGSLFITKPLVGRQALTLVWALWPLWTQGDRFSATVQSLLVDRRVCSRKWLEPDKMNGGTWWENLVIYRSWESISKEVMVDQLTCGVKGDV